MLAYKCTRCKGREKGDFVFKVRNENIPTTRCPRCGALVDSMNVKELTELPDWFESSKNVVLRTCGVCSSMNKGKMIFEYAWEQRRGESSRCPGCGTLCSKKDMYEGNERLNWED